MAHADVLDADSQRHLPFLLGIADMKALDVHFCCRTGSFIIPGPAGLKLEACPGTTKVQMQQSHHWHLPLGNPKLAKRNSYMVEPWTESNSDLAEKGISARLDPKTVISKH